MKSALIIDDEVELKEVYSKYLSHLGYEDVVLSNDSLDAFVLCSQRKFDVITLDHKMPLLKGADFLKALRSRPGVNQFTPVMMISGFVPDFYDSIKTIENTFFLDKPIDLEKFSKYLKLITVSKESA
ncbi:MAG: response regulator [Bacteriovoracia bacterium]